MAFKFTKYLAIILNLFAFVSVCWGRTYLEIEQPQSVHRLEDVLNPEFKLLSETSDKFLLGMNFNLATKSVASKFLAHSKKRQVFENSTKILNQFWSLFLARSIELKVQPLSLQELTGQGLQIYDRHLDPYKASNPVQTYLIENMGIEPNLSRSLYFAMQLGFLNNGIEGAKLAFNDRLKRELGEKLYFFSLEVERFKQIKKTELVNKFGVHSEQEDPSQKAANDILKTLQTSPNSKTAMVVKALAQKKNIDLEDIQNLRRFLTEEIGSMLRKNNLETKVQKADSNISYLKGLRKEREKDISNAFGPKTSLAKINNFMFDILALNLLMGESLSFAKDFINYNLKSTEQIIDFQKSYKSQLDWIDLSDYLLAEVTSLNLSLKQCKSFLK